MTRLTRILHLTTLDTRSDPLIRAGFLPGCCKTYTIPYKNVAQAVMIRVAVRLDQRAQVAMRRRTLFAQSLHLISISDLEMNLP